MCDSVVARGRESVCVCVCVCDTLVFEVDAFETLEGAGVCARACVCKIVCDSDGALEFLSFAAATFGGDGGNYLSISFY